MKNLFLCLVSVSVFSQVGLADSREHEISQLTSSTPPTVNANESATNCPTGRLKGFEGTFKGVLSAVNFHGERQPLENMIETQTVTNCTAFDADIHYSNPQTGKETREVKFSGQWDEAKEGFVITGPVIQGFLRVIRQGQFMTDFDTKFGGNPAHCNEVITVTSNAQQVVRSVQCFAGGLGGPSLGVRTILASRVKK